MERQKNSKFLSLVSVVVGVVSLSIGFLAYSTTIVINDEKEKGNYTDFDINLSSVSDRTVSGVIIPELSDYGITNFYADNARIINTEISTKESGTSSVVGLKAHFTEPGQYVTYKLYSINDGKYVAYLKEVNFKNIDTKSVYKICTAEGDTRQDLVDAACNKIFITVDVAGDTFTNRFLSSRVFNVDSHILGRGVSELVTITIYYEPEEKGEIARADGPFNIEFGDIVLTYSQEDK